MADTKLHDPLGREIILHDHTWFGHIIKRHSEMRPYRALVERAITDPLEIRISDADHDCRVFFGPGPRKAIMTVVFAQLSGGFVKTAHLVKTPKGVVEWSKPTP